MGLCLVRRGPANSLCCYCDANVLLTQDCLWDYVLSDVGQDCFPLWFEVEEGGQKSVVMGAVFYFPIGEHSEEETAPRREVLVIMLPKSETKRRGAL